MLERLFVELADDPVGGILAVPVADTVKRADAEQRVAATEPRDSLWQAQTPQMFRYGQLQKSLENEIAVTDEAGAIEAAGLKPKLVRGDSTNLKVTWPADLALAAMILRARQ
jgi:2-C-methyl-D-erythritol 4-phosphate cytidylyltransferase